jgi:hypothetical protein
MGNSITCSINCKYNLGTRLYALEKWFVFRCVIVNTLRKSDDEEEEEEEEEEEDDDDNHKVSEFIYLHILT